MKNYLNQEERRIATYICIVYGLIETLFANKKNISKEELTALKYSDTYLDKYIQALIRRVGPEEGNRIYKEAMNNKVELKPKNYEGQLVVDKDSLEEVARMAVETHCFGCKREDWRNCGLYKCMDKLQMGQICDEPGKCEFYYEKED